MRKRFLSSLRTFIAMLFMVFATNFAPTAAVFAAQPTGVGNNVECPTGTGLVQQGNNCKVTICHRTNSVTNPYVSETVDVDSVDGNAGNDNGKGDHYLEHTGPVFDSSVTYPTPHNGDQWGDIIPAIPGIHSGLNWTAAGQAIYNNGCEPTTPPEETDVCPNIEGNQTSVPEGYTVDEHGDCVTPPEEEDVCPNLEGDQSEVPSGYELDENGDCVVPPTDVCPNIDDTQTSVPSGMEVDENGDCVTPPEEEECPTGVGLSEQGNNCKITICHATSAVNHPYVRITVALDAADGDAGNDNGQGDHFLEHTGPVFNDSMEQGDDWGDIIPPIPGVHSGLNWSSEGQAIYDNDCEFTTPPEETEDVCPNIEGDQSEVPEDKVVDDNGDCVTPGRGGGETPEETVTQIITVNKPLAPAPAGGVGAEELVNTGSNVLLNIFVGLAILGLTAGLAIATPRRVYE